MPISIIFFGTPAFAIPALKTLLDNPGVKVKLAVTQPDKPAGRGKKLEPPPVKTLCQEHGVPVLQPDSLRREEAAFLSAAREHGPFDAGVVAAFGQILPPSILLLPRAGCINIHASLLPRWRGAAPIQRAIWNGDSKSGVCLMQMDAGLDSGPILARTETPIDDSTAFGALHDKLSLMGAMLLGENLAAIAAGTITPAPQDSAMAIYAAKIEPEETRIDWLQPAEQLARQVRALSPAPGAYCRLSGQRLRILGAVPKTPARELPASPPGSVCTVDKDRLEVKCGSGVLAFTEVQLEGRRRMSIADFLRGCRVEEGANLSAQGI